VDGPRFDIGADDRPASQRSDDSNPVTAEGAVGERCRLNSRGNLNILSEARVHALELISPESASTRSKKSFARLWSVEKFDADASYHPMIVLSNLFRSVMQYMVRIFTAWTLKSLVRWDQNVPEISRIYS
jgi:hypothetical protein